MKRLGLAVLLALTGSTVLAQQSIYRFLASKDVTPAQATNIVNSLDAATLAFLEQGSRRTESTLTNGQRIAVIAGSFGDGPTELRGAITNDAGNWVVVGQAEQLVSLRNVGSIILTVRVDQIQGALP